MCWNHHLLSITSFNVGKGHKVGVLGLGGLGHMAGLQLLLVPR
jgi:D-arabinose 1-dehydrogenase-like Zn-dependent alcohol dehydrogenase